MNSVTIEGIKIMVFRKDENSKDNAHLLNILKVSQGEAWDGTTLKKNGLVIIEIGNIEDEEKTLNESFTCCKIKDHGNVRTDVPIRGGKAGRP